MLDFIFTFYEVAKRSYSQANFIECLCMPLKYIHPLAPYFKWANF